jgi:hypothetical protein
MRSKGTPKKGIDGGSSGGGKSEAKSPAPRGHGPLVACEVVEDWGRALERPSRDSVWFPKGCFSPRAPGEGRAPPWASPPRTKRVACGPHRPALQSLSTSQTELLPALLHISI